MANASVEGQRYIVVGVDIDGNGRKQIHGIDRDDFTGDPSYQALANEFIEPPIRIRYQPVMVGSRRVGVQYSLFERNLRAPSRGKLKLLF
jgi:hypothetical protein